MASKEWYLEQLHKHAEPVVVGLIRGADHVTIGDAEAFRTEVRVILDAYDEVMCARLIELTSKANQT